MTEKESDFLTDLEVLTRKHGIAIGGCGCCGSPWLEELTEKRLTLPYTYHYADRVFWDNLDSEENLQKQRLREEEELKRNINRESDLQLYAKYGNKPLKDDDEVR